MLTWFRKWSRPMAGAALVSLVTLTLSSAAPHPESCHDAECQSAAVHDPSSHSVSRPQESSGHPIHCVLCHWTRSLRPTSEVAPLFAPVVTADMGGSHDVYDPLSQTAVAQPSLRAPPASPRLA